MIIIIHRYYIALLFLNAVNFNGNNENDSDDDYVMKTVSEIKP